MASVYLYNGDTGNLRAWPIFNYGYEMDTVWAHGQFNYEIRTYEDNDYVYFLNSGPLTRSTVYLGSGNDTLEGSAGNDVVFDGSGMDIVRTYGGNDTVYAGSGFLALEGGTGNDTISFYYASNDGLTALAQNWRGVRVDLGTTANQTFNVVYQGGTYLLNEGYIYDVENAEGGMGNDTLLGTNGANILTGHSGSDGLTGRGGNDVLLGDAGADVLVGGAGADTIDCGVFLWIPVDGNRDTVRYLSVADSGTTAATRDTVLHFDRNYGPADTGSDRFDFSPIDANAAVAGDQAFIWRGAGAFTANAGGEIRFQDMGADIMIWVDTDGDTAAEMSILVKNVDTLTAADFIL